MLNTQKNENPIISNKVFLTEETLNVHQVCA